MAGPSKKRKKTKPQSAPTKKIPTLREGLSSSYIQMYTRTVRKHLKFLGLDEYLFDKLSKQAQRYLMLRKSGLPIFRAREGSKVPNVYIREMNKYLSIFLRKTLYTDNDFGYTFADYHLVGMGFDTIARNVFDDITELTLKDKELLRSTVPIARSEKILGIRTEMLGVQNMQVNLILNICSKINFRYYYYKQELKVDYSKAMMLDCYYIYAQEREEKTFKIDNLNRTGIRLGIIHQENCVTWASIKQDQIFNVRSDDSLPVYVQKHALIRMKERIDISTAYRNTIFMATFVRQIQFKASIKEQLKKVKSQEDADFIKYLTKYYGIRTAVNGQKLIPAFDHFGLTIGYFPFTVLDGCVVILSFLPLLSPITPEGKALQEILKLDKQDVTYWGMDKLRFFLETDFDRVPILMHALAAAGALHLATIRLPEEVYNMPIIERKPNPILEKFFHSLQEYCLEQDFNI